MMADDDGTSLGLSFKIGDKVRKRGKPQVMTINDINGGVATCVFERYNQMKSVDIPLADLEPYRRGVGALAGRDPRGTPFKKSF